MKNSVTNFKNFGSLFAALILIVLLLPFVADANPPSGDAGGGKTDVSISRENVMLDLSLESFGFMLRHIPLSATLAQELGITSVRTVKLKDGYLFNDTGFQVLLESSIKEKKKIVVKFSYSIGIDSPFPVKTSGSGEAVVTVKSDDKKRVVADVKLELDVNDSAVDKIAKQLPYLLQAFFSWKMEQLFRGVESLYRIIDDDPEYIMEIVRDEEDVFTIADRKAIEKLLKRKFNS